MTPGDATQAAYEARVGGPQPSLTPITDLIASLGGSTARAAEQLGVSPRTVQRYRVAEGKGPHGGKQARGTRALAAVKAQRQAALDRAGPIQQVEFGAYFRISDTYVYRARTWDLLLDQQADLRAALLNEDWDAAGAIVFEAYSDGSGLEVDEVDFLFF